jgi:programmed cell death protein 5
LSDIIMAEDEEELEAIRKKKMEELQRYGEQQVIAEEQEERFQAQKQAMLRKLLTPEARERLGRLKLAYPDVVENVENQLILLARSGRVGSVIDDATLVGILSKIMPKKRDIKIQRR